MSVPLRVPTTFVFLIHASVAPEKCLYIIKSGHVTLFRREKRDTARETVAVALLCRDNGAANCINAIVGQHTS